MLYGNGPTPQGVPSLGACRGRQTRRHPSSLNLSPDSTEERRSGYKKHLFTRILP
jgi:hypothetical protein